MRAILAFFATVTLSLSAFAGATMNTCYGTITAEQRQPFLIDGKMSYKPLVEAWKKIAALSKSGASFSIKQGGMQQEYLVESTSFESTTLAAAQLSLIVKNLKLQNEGPAIDPSVSISFELKGCTSQRLSNP